MKIFISLIVGVFCFVQISAQEHYYYYKGEKIYLELNPDYIFISSIDENYIQNAKVNAAVDNNNSTEMAKDIVSQTLNKPIGFVERNPVRYWKEINLSDNLSPTNYLGTLAQLKTDNVNLTVAPYFRSETTDKIGLSNYFYVKLKHQNDFKTLLKQIEVHNVELVGYNKFMPLWFTLSVKPKSPNAMQMANVFYETGLFQYAEPTLIADIRLNSTENSSADELTPSDTFYPDQWHLNNTGQNGGTVGIDINAEDAWDITTGENSVIAIIDDGFEMDHPDLAGNTIGDSYDANTDTSPSEIYGPHGTSCAGIAGASGNNNEGVAGVAYNADLVSISGTIVSRIPDAINWAWQNGADVISNSWSSPVTSALIDDAIDNALTNGRGGLGTIVVFATGNENGAISYPANSNPNILSVGAMSPCGERKNPGSCDGEPWGSNFGNELDIVAPGVLIPTTDRQGDVLDCEDYNPSPCQGGGNYANWNYTNRFNGTSSACPIVAGVAALVLSANPNLTVQEVNDIIEQSAQKVRNDIYGYGNVPNRPNGTWDNETGYGLVDAHQAVLLAQAQNCDVNLTLSATINSGTYEASNTINATGNIGANQSVTFNAGNLILINDAFVANSANGSTFLARIQGCDIAPLINETDTNNSIIYVMESAEQRLNADKSVSFKNYPNPFTGHTTIEFTLSKDAPVTLSVSDVTGKQMTVLLDNEQKRQGTHLMAFDGNDYPAGMYYYTIKAGEYVGTQKMILVK